MSMEVNRKETLKEVFQMAWPSVLESFFVALAGVVDSLMVSSMGAYAVAAVGLTTNPKFVALIMFTSMNVAISAIVARRKGQGNQESANQALLALLLYVVLVGAVVSALAVHFADDILHFCGSAEDTHEGAVLYYKIIVSGMLFNTISLAINAAQRGCGNTKIAMKTNVTANLVNMLFNYLLIGGNFGFPELGIKGAAYATVLGTVVACGMSIASILPKDGFISIPYIIKHKVKPAWDATCSMFRIGSTIFLEQFLVRIGFMLAAIMTASLGTDAFAANQVGNNMISLSFSFADGMQVAAIALIGRSLGQERPDLAKIYGALCQKIGAVISIIVAILYIGCGEWYFSLYFEEPHIIEMGVTIARIAVVVVVSQISQVIYMGCLRGAGDVKFTMIASTFSITIIRPLVTYILVFMLQWGLVGIWLGILIDQSTRLLLTRWRFRSGKWAEIKM